MTATEWIAVIGAALGGLGGLATVVFTQLRALRKDRQDHQKEMATLKREELALRAREAQVATRQRAETTASIDALRTEVKAATGGYSVETIAKAIAPEGDPK